jgi:mono/diheme cytochrome c family protein
MAAPAPASDAGSEPASPHGLDEIAVMTWKNQCVRCHGELGNGDGIQPGVHPPDLGDPQVQASLSDLQIAEIIRGGRGVMPAFALPDNTIVALVGLVRLLNRAPREGSDDSDKLVAVPVDAGPARAGTGAPPPSGTTKQRSR